MTRPRSLSLSDAVHRIFEHEASQGPGSDPVEAGAIISRVHQRLFAQLAPVIGEAGFNAIFARTLKGLVTTFPILIVPMKDDGKNELSHLVTTLTGHSAESVLEIGTGLHTLFCIQLATFIGEALVFRLLRNEWPAALAVDSPDSEGKA